MQRIKDNTTRALVKKITASVESTKEFLLNAGLITRAGRLPKYLRSKKFKPMRHEDNPVFPDQECYLMKCCDCGLVHHIKFSAIEKLEFFKDGSFAYEDLDPDFYGVKMEVFRHK